MDEALIRAINGLTANPIWAGLGTVLSSRWMIPLVCGPLFVILLRKRRFWAIASIALAMGCGDIVTARILKPIIGRERPCRELEGLNKVARCGSGRSMPSGHATVAFAFLMSAAPTVPYGWAVFVPFAVGVAGSRVLLGVHYPSDVTAGAVVGSIMGLAFGRLRKRKEGKVKESTSSPPSSL